MKILTEFNHPILNMTGIVNLTFTGFPFLPFLSYHGYDRQS
ncbi:hypothetical protein SAMN05444349_12534 [Bacteroides faecichinchillae]|uniref:Uncharacterized protein n=1 Tax=Bacteroides faecichinchillae TaxID=871325 RepID=A0A1M5CQV9_9BACE|nr:hypothetical protein SAMN05444349_12534 [Bacteroides faecichinchillae]